MKVQTIKSGKIFGLFAIINCAVLYASYPNQYYSQWKQDKYLNETIFKGERGLTFVEVGSYDGKKSSNTYFFEKTLGWKGICIEPLPGAFKLLEQNRSCICLNVCISEHDGLIPFFTVGFELGGEGMLSGRVDTWEKEHDQRWIQSGKRKKKVIQVPSKPLSSILQTYNISHIDYLSVDVEGGELDVLKSIDWEKTDITVMTVENNYDKKETRNFLSDKGYVRICQLGKDDVWIKANKTYLVNGKG